MTRAIPELVHLRHMRRTGPSYRLAVLILLAILGIFQRRKVIH